LIHDKGGLAVAADVGKVAKNRSIGQKTEDEDHPRILGESEIFLGDPACFRGDWQKLDFFCCKQETFLTISP